ncbi:MAG: hypothetical protein ACMUHX_03560 [bacterium]
MSGSDNITPEGSGTVEESFPKQQKFAEKYSVENITEKVLRLYARVLVLRKTAPGSK